MPPQTAIEQKVSGSRDNQDFLIGAVLPSIYAKTSK
jgi:hypothetical protein